MPRNTAAEKLDNAITLVVHIVRDKYPQMNSMTDAEVAEFCRLIHSTLPSKGLGRKGTNRLGGGVDSGLDEAQDILDVLNVASGEVVQQFHPVQQKETFKQIQVMAHAGAVATFNGRYASLLQSLVDDAIPYAQREKWHAEIVAECIEELGGFFMEGEGYVFE